MATEHWVGGEKGWALGVDYQAWAKDKVFKVGDTLVFKYTQGHHNVFKVNQTAFQNCVVPPPSEALTSGYDAITLVKPGKKWYICGIPTHCSDYSQKLVITVEDGAPAPAPISPAPPMEYWVGGDKGWAIDVDYQAWAKGKNFKVGDKLVFKYTQGHHNVFKVNQTAFHNCIVPPPSEALTSGHDVITLAKPGKKWYICGIPKHCSDHKQKLVITVEGEAPAPAPVAPAPASPMEYWVGGDKGWAIDVDYQAWAKGKTFKVGDKLVFKYTKGHHNVFKVNQTSFKDCIIPPPSEGLTSGHDVITLAQPGKKWYICGIPTHCSDHNQKLAITVEGEAPVPAPTTTAPAPVPGTKDDSNHSNRVTMSAYKIFVGGVVLIWTILTLV
ncbi:hypothetical protein BC332_26537 [Capsicum chinense]|nr:hypothetical protein BC332_26537 [Capsicum chinense]